MMKKRVIVNYSSAYGLPGVQPDAGMALIHLLESNSITLDAIIVSGAQLPRITSAIDWLLKFSGRTDVRVFGRCRSEDQNEIATVKAADSFVAYLNKAVEAEAQKAVLLDIGEPQVLGLAAGVMSSLSDYFSEIVLWNPTSMSPQRREVVYPQSSLQDEELRSVYIDSGCILTTFGEGIAFQSPLDIDELVDIRKASKPLYYMLKDYLLNRAASGHVLQDFLYRLPPAVYMSHPELFSIDELSKNGITMKRCSNIADIKAYNSILHASWTTWHKREVSI